MITCIRGKNILKNGAFSEGCVFIDNGKIISEADVGAKEYREYDFGEDYVIPGLIDLHTHGAVGVDYGGASCEEILKAISFQRSYGATSVMPTVTSSTFEKTCAALENIREAMKDESIGCSIIGVHLEGPYFSEKQSGAQEKSMLGNPKPEHYKYIVENFGDIIKRWDYAPELDINGEFCEYLKAHNIIPSAAHTDAKYGDMCLAREKGCNLVTHLYSCTSTITREMGFRVLGVIECAYLWDDMYIEIIADGKHLPIELLRLIFKLKPHDKIILVSDSLKVAGSTERYSNVGNMPCIIEDGVCKLLDRSAFAGSIATADVLIKKAVEAGLDLSEAVKMGSENPAYLFGLSKGKLDVGYDGDITVLDKDLNVKKVFVKGEITNDN